MNGFQGFNPLSTWGSEFNSQYAIIRAILSDIHTSVPAKVLNVTNSGGVSAVGFVDLQPLVNQVTGDNIAVPQGIIYNVPYFRLQGGHNAIIIDPEVGDIGDAIFCERDISSVIINKARSNPGSGRIYNISDGLFICGFLGVAPTQYVQFNTEGITIHSPVQVHISAPDVKVDCTTAEINASASVHVTSPTTTLDGNLVVNGVTTLNGPIAQHNGIAGSGATMDGPLTVTAEVTGNGNTVSAHHHTQPADSHGDTEANTSTPVG